MRIVVCTRRIRPVHFGTHILYQSDIIIEPNDDIATTQQVAVDVPSGAQEREISYQIHERLVREAIDNATL